MVGTPKSKGGKKGKKKKTEKKDELHYVDKTFYEIQIVDLNRKLARQRERVFELEETVSQLDSKLGKMNDDHGDIISYLKRNLSERGTEVADLQLQVQTLTEQNEALQEAHAEEMEKFKEEYQEMREQLLSTVKILTGQLNALEDYRVHREELLRKFEEVQNELDAQELKYKKQIYELEKKNIVGKANLKREMEEKLFDLAANYQEANQIRIAATSQRVVRENIALNHEINNLIGSTKKLDHENLLIKKQIRQVIVGYNALEEGHKKKMHQFSLQTGVIRELTNVNLKQKKILDQYEKDIQKLLEDRRKLKELLSQEDMFVNKIKNLERRLNAARYSQRDLQTQLSAEIKFRHHLEMLINDVSLLIKSTLLEHPEIRSKVQIPNKENLLTNIIDILTFAKSDISPPTPYGTVSSASTVHLKSEGGLPENQLIADMKPPIKKINVMTYLGPSFEDFFKKRDVKLESIQSETSEKETTDAFFASCSEETLVSMSSEEETSSFDGEVDDLKDVVTLAPNEMSKVEKENIEEEQMEEEKMEDEKMDEEKEDADFDDTY